MAGPDAKPAAARSPWLYTVIGVLVTLVVVLTIVVAMLLGGGTGGLASATSSPGGLPTGVALASGGSSEPSSASTEPSAEPTLEVTAGPSAPAATVAAPKTPAPTTRSTPKPSVAPSPTASIKPKIDSFISEPNYVTNCASGVYLTLTWLTTNADRVDIAVDPQGESPLQHLYADHQALDGSFGNLYYSCHPPNADSTGAEYHEYVVIAYRGSAIAWKSIRVYVQPTV